jgi:DNA-binding CsgD family transcriptional regulator
MLEACPYAALACDERARLIACNGSASALLRDGLSVVGGRVTICDGLVHKRFLRLLNAHADAQPAALLVPRPSGRPSLQMLLTETAAAAGRAADDGVQRLWKVVISDPSNIAPATVQAFASLYGLTPAEVRLAQQLLLGATLQEAACRAQVKISTVRSQLNTLLRKTGTRRQAELVRVLSVVPA